MTHFYRFFSIISLCVIFTSCKWPANAVHETGSVTEITSYEAFEKEVLTKTQTQMSVVDVYATWCGPCKKMKPVFSKLSKEFSDVKFFAVNIDSVKQISQKFNIKGVPAFLFFKDGKEIDRVIGSKSESEFRTKLHEVKKK